MSEIKQVENMERKYKQTDIGLVLKFGLTLFSTRYKPHHFGVRTSISVYH